ncbi:MAG: hypothetical protein HWE26_22585 [Alteromonadaceae bacterium]|nr:hypothetical protein [Alteromonadaceae bacterium]
MDFKDLPLHDGLVKNISINWSNRSAEVVLECFLLSNQASQPCSLRFSNVSSVNIPMVAPWGKSSSINAAKYENNAFQIEMQSGDTLQVEAATFGFETIGL